VRELSHRSVESSFPRALRLRVVPLLRR
jgi:hypothetical protein